MRTSVPFPSVPPVSTAPLLSPDLLDLELHQLRGLLGAGLVHASRLPARPARVAGLARAPPPPLERRLADPVSRRLWTHLA